MLVFPAAYCSWMLALLIQLETPSWIWNARGWKRGERVLKSSLDEKCYKHLPWWVEKRHGPTWYANPQVEGGRHFLISPGFSCRGNGRVIMVLFHLIPTYSNLSSARDAVECRVVENWKQLLSGEYATCCVYFYSSRGKYTVKNRWLISRRNLEGFTADINLKSVKSGLLASDCSHTTRVVMWSIPGIWYLL